MVFNEDVIAFGTNELNSEKKAFLTGIGRAS